MGTRHDDSSKPDPFQIHREKLIIFEHTRYIFHIDYIWLACALNPISSMCIRFTSGPNDDTIEKERKKRVNMKNERAINNELYRWMQLGFTQKKKRVISFHSPFSQKNT